MKMRKSAIALLTGISLAAVAPAQAATFTNGDYSLNFNGISESYSLYPDPVPGLAARAAERREGKQSVRTCRARWSQDDEAKTHNPERQGDGTLPRTLNESRANKAPRKIDHRAEGT